MKQVFLTLCVFLVLLATANAGELYDCIDSDGNAIITDNPQDGMEKCTVRGTTGMKYEGVLNTLLGHSIQRVVNALGYPSKEFRAPNGNMIYMFYQGKIIPGFSHSYYSGFRQDGYISGNIYTYQSKDYERYCLTYFEVDKNKIIVNWSYAGNWCPE